MAHFGWIYPLSKKSGPIQWKSHGGLRNVQNPANPSLAAALTRAFLGAIFFSDAP
jgi:hypothetical protein